MFFVSEQRSWEQRCVTFLTCAFDVLKAILLCFRSIYSFYVRLARNKGFRLHIDNATRYRNVLLFTLTKVILMHHFTVVNIYFYLIFPKKKKKIAFSTNSKISFLLGHKYLSTQVIVPPANVLPMRSSKVNHTEH